MQQKCGDARGEAGAGKGEPGPSAAGEARARERRTPWRDGDRKRVGKHKESMPGKAAMALYVPVPETDTGGQGENPQADGRSIVKELGKMAP